VPVHPAALGQLGSSLGGDVALERATDGDVQRRDVGLDLTTGREHDVTFRRDLPLDLAVYAERPRRHHRALQPSAVSENRDLRARPLCHPNLPWLDGLISTPFLGFSAPEHSQLPPFSDEGTSREGPPPLAGTHPTLHGSRWPPQP